MTFLFLLFPSLALAFTYSVEVRGPDAFVSSAGSSHQSPLRSGMQAQDGDTVQTGDRTVVMLVSDNGHKLSVGPRSSLFLDSGNEQAVRFNRVELLRGSVRSVIRGSGNDTKKFELRSNSVSVGVRGTDFFSVAQAQGLKVYLQEGSLYLQEKQLLKAGNKATISADGAVSSSPMGPGEYEEAMDHEGFREIAALVDTPPASRGNEKTLTLLVQSGDIAALEARHLSADELGDFGHGEGAFHVALKNGRGEFVPWLLEKRVNVNAGDREGKTPLMIAIERKDLSSIRALVAGGASKIAKDAQGLNSFDYARKTESKAIQDFLAGGI